MEVEADELMMKHEHPAEVYVCVCVFVCSCARKMYSLLSSYCVRENLLFSLFIVPDHFVNCAAIFIGIHIACS
jgi:hypothetical protein